MPSKHTKENANRQVGKNGYFFQGDKTSSAFAKFPLELFFYSALSSEARILYVFMRNRVTLSMSNGWHDEAGRIYIYCTRKEGAQVMNCSERSAQRFFDELGKERLIETKRQGLGKPNIIYVKKLPNEE